MEMAVSNEEEEKKKKRRTRKRVEGRINKNRTISC